MLELSQSGAGETTLGYVGDTLNTAIYLSRLGVKTQFISALGQDPYSDRMVEAWGQEGISTAHILRHPTRLPGLYAIETDAAGERRFFYWRQSSAMRDFFALPDHKAALAAAADADWLYLSGITLSLFSEREQRVLCDVALAIKAKGGEVFFDPNYRPNGWTTPKHAKLAMAAMAPGLSVVLPTLGDEDLLFGKAAPEVHAERWRQSGISTVVFKNGPKDALVFPEGHAPERIPAKPSLDVVDTTAAGDSFNAGLIAARARGVPLTVAVEAGHELASRVVQSRGAIMAGHCAL